MSSIEICILARDRGPELERAIEAVNVLHSNFNIKKIISWNPSSLEIAHKCVPGWECRHRNNLDAYDHFRLVQQESTEDWIIVTHDDDELLQNLIECVEKCNKIDEIGVVSGRTEIKNSDFEPLALTSYKFRLRKFNSSPDDIYDDEYLFNYILEHGSIFPLSAIAIRQNLFKSIEVDKKYSFVGDYAYGLKLVSPSSMYNKTYYSSCAVLNYYLHKNQDSQNPRMLIDLPVLSALCKIETLFNYRNYVTKNVKMKIFFEYWRILSTYPTYQYLFQEEIENHSKNYKYKTIYILVRFRIFSKISSLVLNINKKVIWKLQTRRGALIK